MPLAVRYADAVAGHRHADEPCAGLNPTETASMIDVLRQVRSSGVTVLLVEHDMPSVMEVSDRILVLSERPGTVIAEIKVDLPHRDHPLKRRTMPEVGDYAAQIFRHLKLEEKAI